MRNEFVVRLKNSSKTETSVTMTIRIDRELQQKYDELSAKSGHSRNELITMALQYYRFGNEKSLSRICLEHDEISVSPKGGCALKILR